MLFWGFLMVFKSPKNVFTFIFIFWRIPKNVFVFVFIFVGFRKMFLNLFLFLYSSAFFFMSSSLSPPCHPDRISPSGASPENSQRILSQPFSMLIHLLIRVTDTLRHLTHRVNCAYQSELYSSDFLFGMPTVILNSPFGIYVKQTFHTM